MAAEVEVEERRRCGGGTTDGFGCSAAQAATHDVVGFALAESRLCRDLCEMVRQRGEKTQWCGGCSAEAGEATVFV